MLAKYAHTNVYLSLILKYVLSFKLITLLNFNFSYKMKWILANFGNL